MKSYSIPFKGLKLGKHQFDFDITDAFFDEFEYSLVKKGNLNCKIELEKQETLIILHFEIKGVAERMCDRCLSEFMEPVNIREKQIVKFGEDEADEGDDEIMVLNRNEHELDLSGLIYEYINVAMPLTSICENEGKTRFCDQEMLEKLEKLSGSSEENTEDSTDPRWNVLKNINK